MRIMLAANLNVIVGLGACVLRWQADRRQTILVLELHPAASHSKNAKHESLIFISDER